MRNIDYLDGIDRTLEAGAHVFNEAVFAFSETDTAASRSLRGKKIGHVMIRAQRQTFFEDEELTVYPIAAEPTNPGGQLWVRQQQVAQFTDRIVRVSIRMLCRVQWR